MSGWRDYRDKAEGSGTRRLTLLVVDDEERILESLTELFRERFDVVIARGGKEAIRVFRERRPHLVLSDQRMPGTTGIELLKEIRTIEPGTIRMLITGYSDIEVVIEAVNEEILHRYVTKPWVNEELVEVVTQCARRYLEENGLAGDEPGILF